MICGICGREGANLHLVARSYGNGDSLLVIEKVPMMSCSNCGESYLTAATLHEIEHIKLHLQQMAVKRPVAVVEFM